MGILRLTDDYMIYHMAGTGKAALLCASVNDELSALLCNRPSHSLSISVAACGGVVS